MDKIMYLLGIGVIALIGLSIFYKLIKTAVATIAIVVIVAYLWQYVPIQYKACLDLTLALTGSEVFKEVSEENLAYIKALDIHLVTKDGLTLAYPEYYQAAKPSTSTDNNDIFNTDLFTQEKNVRAIKIVTSHQGEETVQRVLKELGIKQ
jgi:hypothetical protein